MTLASTPTTIAGVSATTVYPSISVATQAVKILKLKQAKMVIMPTGPMAEHGLTPTLLLNRGRLGYFDQVDVDGAIGNGLQVVEADVTALLKSIQALEIELNSQLVGANEMIHVIMNALLTGDNPFLYSLPGAAKSSLGSMIAKAILGKYFNKVMSPDLSQNDLFGPVSIAGLKADKWTRNWTGLATAVVALLDEFYKSSQAVRTLVLNIAEEHIVSDADGSYQVPLLLMMGASNELVNATARDATWDRWLYRVEAGYPRMTDEAGLARVLGSAGGRKPMTVMIDPAEILLLQGLVEYMGMNLPQSLHNKMAVILTQLSTKGILPSPRRVKGWARAIVAEAFLMGARSPSLDHLAIGRHILWIDPVQRKEVDDIVSGAANPDRATILRARADVETYRNQIATATEQAAIATAVSRIRAVLKQLQILSDTVPDRDATITDIQAVINEGSEKVFALLGGVDEQ